MGDGISKEKFEEYEQANAEVQEKMRQQYDALMADKKRAEENAARERREYQREINRMQEQRDKQAAQAKKEHREDMIRRDNQLAEERREHRSEMTKFQQEQARQSAAAKKDFDDRMNRMEQRAANERNEMYRKHQQQMDQQAAENKRNIESIMNKNAADQKAALKVHQEQSEKALKEQKDMFNRMENERKEAAKKEMNIVRVSFGKLKV